MKLPVLLAVLWAASLCRAADIGSVARPFPDSRGKVMVFTDQLPEQLSEGQWKFIAGHYVGCQKQSTTWSRHIHRLNNGFVILHYQLAVGNGPAAFLVGDKWVNDFAEVSKHDDWFFHDPQGSRILQPAWTWYVMDIRFASGRPASGYPDYWVRAALERMRVNEDDGVFADSYTQDILMGQVRPLCEPFKTAEANKKNWLGHLNQFGGYCAAALHAQKEKFYYLPNLGGLVTTWDTVTDLGVGDGGMNEGFCAPGPGSYYSDADWKLAMTRLLKLAAREKIVLCQTSIDAGNADHLWFVVGSYLLTKGRHSYLNMMQKSSLEWYPHYTLDLGGYADEPKEDVSAYWDPRLKLFKRAYAKGVVLVNPGATSVTIDDVGPGVQVVEAHGGGAVGPEGQEVGSLSTAAATRVTIPGHSARVLLGPGHDR